MSQPLSEKNIRKFLSAQNADFSVVVFDRIDSTNAEALRRATVPVTPTLVVAERQTAGRGRLGRSFYSPQGGLYMTVLLPFANKPITLAAGVAVCAAVREVCGKTPTVKWVNDVMLDGKKVCGILAESVAMQYVAVGIGINLSTDGFPDTLTRAGGVGDFDRNRLAACVVDRLTEELRRPDAEIIDSYRLQCETVGQTVSYTKNGQTFTATALNIADDGGLVLSNGETLRTGGLNN